MKALAIGSILVVLLPACGATTVPGGPDPGTGEDAADSKDARPPSGPFPADAGVIAMATDCAPDSQPGVTGPACIEKPAPRPGPRAPLTVNVELTYGGKPIVFGEPFAVADGTLTLTNFRFYISEIALLRNWGENAAVDVIGADGAPAPYNLHLVNPEDPSGMTFQLAAPIGSYGGISFLLGIPDSCNGGDPASRQRPLTWDSQMTWPPPFGYLFLRYAGTLAGAPATATTPTQIDVGGFPGALLAPRVPAYGYLVIADLSARTVRLRVAVDELFRASTLPATLDEAGTIITSGPTSGTAFLAGEHVRQNAPRVSIFSLWP
jgi:hypothetical protein